MSIANLIDHQKSIRFFSKFRNTVLLYWQSQPKDTREWYETLRGAKAPDNEKSLAIRQTIMEMVPEASDRATSLGIGHIDQSYPAPAVGGPVLPVDVFAASVDQNVGHGSVERKSILDRIDACIGAAKSSRRKEINRLINPLNWVIDILTYFIKLPFIILIKAGLPPSIEGQIWAQVLKAAILLATIGIAIYLGWEKYLAPFLR